jgi:hypothetical protein
VARIEKDISDYDYDIHGMIRTETFDEAAKCQYLKDYLGGLLMEIEGPTE